MLSIIYFHTVLTCISLPVGQVCMMSMFNVVRAVFLNKLSPSGYEAYDRLSPAMKRFLEGLTAVHDGSFFLDVSLVPQGSLYICSAFFPAQYAKSSGIKVQESRGSPENTGTHLKAVQCVPAKFLILTLSLTSIAKSCHPNKPSNRFPDSICQQNVSSCTFRVGHG